MRNVFVPALLISLSLVRPVSVFAQPGPLKASSAGVKAALPAHNLTTPVSAEAALEELVSDALAGTKKVCRCQCNGTKGRLLDIVQTDGACVRAGPDQDEGQRCEVTDDEGQDNVGTKEQCETITVKKK